MKSEKFLLHISNEVSKEKKCGLRTLIIGLMIVIIS